MKTFVYIDGFNLYYGALRNTPYKWLDLHTLCRKLLPHDNICLIRYFTAYVKPRFNDPDQLNRQLVYLRALKTIPLIEIHLGSFLSNTVSRPMADGSGYVNVIEVNEKGSDVNLATYLMHDGHKGLYDTAVLITNDSDLVEPVRIVRYELEKMTGVIIPHPHASRKLLETANFIKRIRTGVLRDSQFPNEMRDSEGLFHKPLVW